MCIPLGGTVWQWRHGSLPFLRLQFQTRRVGPAGAGAQWPAAVGIQAMAGRHLICRRGSNGDARNDPARRRLAGCRCSGARFHYSASLVFDGGARDGLASLVASGLDELPPMDRAQPVIMMYLPGL